MALTELYTHVVNTFELGRIPEDQVEAVDSLLEPHGLGLITVRGPGIGLNLAHIVDEEREALLQRIYDLGLSIALNASASTHPDHQDEVSQCEEEA